MPVLFYFHPGSHAHSVRRLHLQTSRMERRCPSCISMSLCLLLKGSAEAGVAEPPFPPGKMLLFAFRTLSRRRALGTWLLCGQAVDLRTGSCRAMKATLRWQGWLSWLRTAVTSVLACMFQGLFSPPSLFSLREAEGKPWNAYFTKDFHSAVKSGSLPEM